MWTLAWNAHAFVSQPLSIFDANIFHPLRNTLALSENLIGSAVFAAPVLWLTENPVLAVNVVSLLSVHAVRARRVRAGAPRRLERGRRCADRARLRVLAAAFFPFQPAASHRGPVDSVRAGIAARVPGGRTEARLAPRGRGSSRFRCSRAAMAACLRLSRFSSCSRIGWRSASRSSEAPPARLRRRRSDVAGAVALFLIPY